MNDLNQTTKGMRTCIAFLGRRNAGKSSLINALVGFDLAIVSDIAGTTTDPVDKAVEISPLGPCLVIDTAGIDDTGELGQMRIKKTEQVIDDADVGLIIIGDGKWTEYEEKILKLLTQKGKPVIAIINKKDLNLHTELEKTLKAKNIEYVLTSALKKEGIDALKEKLRQLKNMSKLEEPALIGDIIKGGDLVVLVVPIDLGAPKGRLILPQVQTIRDIIDNDAAALVVKERELASTLEKINYQTRLVITDSQVVLKVAGDVPDSIPLTTFSILFSRFKGDLDTMVLGAKAIEKLDHGDKVLIAEACTHHALADDIGRVKIPRWLTRYTGKELHFDTAAGPNFPENLEDYKLIIQCGGCTITRRAYLNRIEKARAHNIPITNYGIAISYVQGVLERTIKPFPEVTDILEDNVL
ncbi:[FeFe] hydrogenase H-cluster maturation GTPase HydF [Thermosyntropha sp.]|uniref:[FeFe] hydrogenase H-cluster maturation GTPase HydF n=1 Tax=Thermosyntropha sp. TaxID=2740820 RepID=UPI0025E5393F|nr:[FeFe] hydrogenase H-cluster maturation GTPase HydF [Thermosyntropha sp.]MBO8158909.1 [FeFe] hydrogenase H-cluster maturation GTPase HydF [Thermosyntropha sp.]